MRCCLLLQISAVVLASLPAVGHGDEPQKVIRPGIIGLDTSHVVAFTRVLNDPTRPDHIPGARVTAAFRGGSYDLEASRSRIDGFTRELTETFGVELCDSIELLCSQVDVVMLESVATIRALVVVSGGRR